MSKLKDILSKELITCAPDSTIQDCVEQMVNAKCGAILIMEGANLAGIFSERDLLVKVVGKKLPLTTKVSEVMTRKVTSATEETTAEEATILMVNGKFRHLPLTNEGKVTGIISVRDLLQSRIEELDSENETLAAFAAADGPGG